MARIEGVAESDADDEVRQILTAHGRVFTFAVRVAIGSIRLIVE